MSNTSIMNSKILINVNEDRLPVITVQEISSDDVKDKLVQMMRQELKFTSNTFTVNFTGPSMDKLVYDIAPVSDEFEYFYKRIIHLSPWGDMPDSENVKKIREFFDSLKSVSMGSHNPEAVKKFNTWHEDPFHTYVAEDTEK